ncbi:MAG: DEAD/DEAH box helicase [Thermoproteota archaeon]
MERIGIRELTEPQERAIPEIAAGKNVLLMAPTGSGKTEAAILPILGKLASLKKRRGISLVYVTPLRALNRDMLRRLEGWCAELGLSVEVRHGDTPPSRRRKPPDVLITTPETLQAILPGARMQANLKAVRWVVVDEVHEIAESKRGVQLAVALERLREVAGRDFQRVGLSATVGTPERVAKLLAGNEGKAEIVRVTIPKGYNYWIQWPLPTEEDFALSASLFTTPEAAARISAMKELADTHASTLIFVNSRQVAEMLALRLGSLDPKIGIHHGSLSREERERIEDGFKKGALKAIVCTSTLELGIDIGSVDLVIQYLSPRQVGPLIQRVGRSGHKLGLTSEGVIITAFVDDALEAIAVVRRAEEGLIEPTKIHENALDVLAHQIVGLSLDRGGIGASRAAKIVSRAYPYRKLDGKRFRSVLDCVRGLGLIAVRGDRIVATRKGRRYYFKNLSMIPDERRYPVVDLTSDRVVGTVGEEFIALRARVGLHFICRGTVWNLERIAEEGFVYVTPVADPRAALPGWDGEILPVPYELANEVGKLRREIAGRGGREAILWLCSRFRIEEHVAKRIAEELMEHAKSGAPIPSDRLILVEGFDRYLIINSCLGESANRALGYVIDRRLSRRGMIRSWWADGYRVLVEMPVEVTESNLASLVKQALPASPEDVEEEFRALMDERFPFGYYMKFVAERFGAIERGLVLSESRLLDLHNRFKRTPIYEETMREVQQEKVDLQALKDAFSAISNGRIRVETFFSSERPTPISYPILDKFAELPETVAPESARRDSIERVRNAILHSRVELICMECAAELGTFAISNLAQRPRCGSCGSTLLAPLPRYGTRAKDALRKRLKGESLTEEEVEQLSNLRRSADIIHSYGKDGAIALSVYGIGPQTASRVLSRMHYSEDELLKDLLEAKLKYIQTRPYWDRQ